MRPTGSGAVFLARWIFRAIKYASQQSIWMMRRACTLSSKSIRVATERETFRRHARQTMVNVMRKRPQSVFVVYRDDSGEVHATGAGMNRLEMIGAASVAMSDLWEND